ncbi:transmembrane protease serine 9-like [Anopheles funestus]|uniref:transmembrane protease serine 9-like n=1 Tax=Anopheles funestus TaxID=62324 RepID=UPI0020C61686|nr:transmembrane protease serine 9-like [Anopheles funestus]
MRSRIWILALLGIVLRMIIETSAQEYRVICGRRKVKTSYLIQNGLDAKPGHWPWHAAIFYIKNDLFDYKCGGSIIDENTILTAAHCVFTSGVKRASEVSIHVGRNHIKEDAEYTQIHDAQDIIVHPKFRSGTIYNDIALIKLDTSITWSKFVQPVCLWNLDESWNTIVGKNGTIVGFGLTEANTVSENLKQTLVGVIDGLKCVEKDRDVFGNQLTSNMICAGGQEGAIACSGDSGGGMFFEIEGKWFVRGIVSFTPRLTVDGLCDASTYTAFTDVSKYMDWITKYVDPRVLSVSSDVIEVDYDEKLELFDLNTCGLVSSTVAADGDRWTLPWLGFVGIYKSSDNTIDKRCAVTLLNEWYAVGPAHCFQNDGLERRVLFGGNSELTEPICNNRKKPCQSPTQMLQIQRVIIHPKYSINNTADNIALIELLNPADTTQPNVQAICIPIIPKLRTNKTEDLSIASHMSFPRSFASKPVNFIDSNDCTAKYAQEEFSLFLETKRLCTQISDRGAQDCIQLKAGGPLQQLRRFNGRRQYFLRGFDLFGRSCSTSLPSVYSNVNNYLDWILYNMRYDILEKNDEAPSNEGSDIEDSWNTLHQEPDREKLSLFNLDTCGVASLNIDTVDERTFYPWMGLLATHKNTMEAITYIESAVVLISDRYALTPAHIINNSVSCLKLQLGSMIDSSDVVCEEGDESTLCDPELQKIPIQRMIVHPQYNAFDNSNNIMLLELSRPVRKPQINPVCLPVDDQIRSYDISDMRAHAFNLLTLNFIAQKLDKHTYFTSSECQTRWNKLALNWSLENVTQCIMAQYSPNTEYSRSGFGCGTGSRIGFVSESIPESDPELVPESDPELIPEPETIPKTKSESEAITH